MIRREFVFIISLAAGGLLTLIYIGLRKKLANGAPETSNGPLLSNDGVSQEMEGASNPGGASNPEGASNPQGPRWLPAEGIDRQYQNRSVSMRDRHPVLAYQMMHEKGINPANIGDPIRIPDVAGPINRNNSFYDALMIRPEATPYYSGQGPYPGEPLGVPVPMSSLREYNERYNRGQFLLPNPHFFTSSYYPTVGSQNLPPGVYQSGTLGGMTPGIPYHPRPLPSGDFFRPYGPNTPIDRSPFYGSVNAYAPFPEITAPWEKAGILTRITGGVVGTDAAVLNLFRRPVAPLQDLWEYQVQDKDGFVIKLDRPFIEDGDIVHHIIGKEGTWKAHIFVQNKYIWV